MARLLVSGAMSEDSIQKAVMAFIRSHPKLANCTIHIPNEGKRSARTGYSLKQMGMLSGVADLFIAYPSAGYHGAWLELKSEKGRASQAQKDFLERMGALGYYTAICYSINEAILEIKNYALIS